MLVKDPPVEISDGLWMLGANEYPVYLLRGRQEAAIFEGGIGPIGPVGVITPEAVNFVDFASRNGVLLGRKQGSTKVTAAHWKLRPGGKLTIANPADGEQFLFVWKG